MFLDKLRDRFGHGGFHLILYLCRQNQKFKFVNMIENFTATHLMETDGQRSPVSFLKFIAPIKGAIIYFLNLIIYLCVRERDFQFCKIIFGMTKFFDRKVVILEVRGKR